MIKVDDHVKVLKDCTYQDAIGKIIYRYPDDTNLYAVRFGNMVVLLEDTDLELIEVARDD